MADFFTPSLRTAKTLPLESFGEGAAGCSAGHKHPADVSDQWPTWTWGGGPPDCVCVLDSALLVPPSCCANS